MMAVEGRGRSREGDENKSRRWCGSGVGYDANCWWAISGKAALTTWFEVIVEAVKDTVDEVRM